jgi:hypothetical protein
VYTPPNSRSGNLARGDGVLTALASGLSFVLYLRTLVSGLLPGDSGEFQTLAYLLGHTHPTGYPVYLVLAKLLTLLPVGEIADRVSAFSAVMAALAVAGVYVAGRLLAAPRAAAFVGASALAVSPTFWSQAVIAEVYTPGAAFLIWVLVALLWWDACGTSRALFIAGLLGGLSLGVHMSVALLAPAVLVFLAATLVARRWEGSVIASLKAALGGGLVGLGLMVFVFLSIDWRDSPAGYFHSVVEPSRSSWGLVATYIDGPLDRLVFGWSARQFRSFMFANPAAVMPRLAGVYWSNLPSELAWPLIVLAGLGAVDLLVRRPRVAALLLITLATQLLFTFNYDIWDLYVFFIPGYMLLTVLAASGLGAVSWPVSRCGGRWRLAADTALAALVFLVAVWPTFRPRLDAVRAGSLAFTDADFEEYPIAAYDDLETVHSLLTLFIKEAPQNAIVFMDWELLYPSYYVAHVEMGRTDLAFIETYPADDQDGLAESVVAFIADQQADHPIFVMDRLPELVTAGSRLSPVDFGGIRLYQVLSRD